MTEKEYLSKEIIDQTPIFFSSDTIISAYWNLSNNKLLNKKDFAFPTFDYIENTEVYFNSYGHRCDEFKKDHEGLKHALFAGCSETFGTGATYGTIWNDYVYEHLNKNKEYSGLFKLGHPGAGFQLILKSIMNYINVIGKPNELYVLLPNLEREIRIAGSDNLVYTNYHYDVKDFPDRSINLETLNEMEYLDLLFEFKERMIMFENYCKTNSIKLFWSTHSDRLKNEILLMQELKNFIPIDFGNTREWTFNNFNKKELDHPEAFYRLDQTDNFLGHRGFIFHKFWANAFIEKIKNNENI